MTAVEHPARTGDVFHRLHTSFGGIPAAQIWADFFLWELVLNDRPDLVAIVEIGTWKGGFAHYLDAQARVRGMAFATYGVHPTDEPTPSGFHQWDVWARVDEIKGSLAAGYGGPVILLCDGGNKVREVKTFAPVLPPKSLIVAHDWGFEFLPEHVPVGLTEVYGDTCDSLGSVSRIFEAAT